MYGTKFIILVSLVAAISLASAAYTPEQSALIDAMQIGWQMGAAYQEAQTTHDATAFNALADKYNAWVQKNFGPDQNIMVKKIGGTAIDLSKPYYAANNSTNGGIVHAIDGSQKWGSQYTTNDINLMPAGAIAQYAEQDRQVDENGQPIPGTRVYGDGYLGGV